MKRRRSLLQAERLETRQLPDVSLWGTAACAPPALPAAQEGAEPSTVPADQLLAGQAVNEINNRALAPAGPASEHLERFFAQPEELETLFAPGADGVTEDAVPLLDRLSPPAAAPAADAPPHPPAAEPGAGQREEDVLFSLHPHAEQAADRTVPGWQFLCNYAQKAIRNDGRRYGPLPDREDLVQQIFVEWWEQVGAEDRALANLLDKGSAELEVLRKVVPRVLSRARYDLGKQARMAEAVDLEARARAAERDWTDLRLDLEAGVARLGERERQVLELRRQGLTFDEIGPEMGMSKQWASDVCQAVLARLQGVYCGMEA